MKKQWKKGIATVVVASLLLSIQGCGSKDKASDTGKENTNTTTATAESEETKDVEYQVQAPKKGDTIVTISFKNFGDVKIKMFPKEAPKAVENFTTHAKEGYYDGLTIHRVINQFMIQGGDPSGNGTGGESIWGKPFEDEIVDYLLPIRGSLCMANAGPDTNGSQFFITQAETADTSSLGNLTIKQAEAFEKYGGCPWLTGGYTVFGQVYEGMDVVDAIAQVQTDTDTAKPKEDVVISHIEVSEYDK